MTSNPTADTGHYPDRPKDDHELFAEMVITGAVSDATSVRPRGDEGAIDDGIRALLHDPRYNSLSGNHISLVCALGDYAAKAVVALAELLDEPAEDTWARLCATSPTTALDLNDL